MRIMIVVQPGTPILFDKKLIRVYEANITEKTERITQQKIKLKNF